MHTEAEKFKKDWQRAQKARRKSGVEQDSFVYLHLNADDDQPHHVGIGCWPARPWDMKDRSTKHKNKVEKHGVRVQLLAIDMTWEIACFWEIAWIKALRTAGYKLTNLNDGGEGNKGYKHREDTKAKLSKTSSAALKALGDAHPSKRPETRRKISESRIGKPGVVGEANPISKLTEIQVIAVLESTDSHADMARRFNVSPATIINIRAGDIWAHVQPKAHKPEKYNDGRNKTGAAHPRSGATHSESAKEKLRAHNLGKTHAQETKDLLSAKTAGAKNPRAKISEELAQAVLDFDGTHAEAARNFDLPYGYTVDIRTGVSWKYLKRRERS
jgi:hypothetical protein